MDIKSGNCHNVELQLIHDTKLKELFDEVDKDHSGCISHKELSDFLKTTNQSIKLPRHVINNIHGNADANGDGKLDYREFVQMVHDPVNRELFKTYLNKYINFILPPSQQNARYSRSLSTEQQYNDLYTCCPPPVCMMLISIAEIVLFVVDACNGSVDATGTVAENLIYNPHKRLEMWRFITYMFVHAGYMHLCMNLLIQILLGIILEMAHGWWRVLMIYLAGVLAGSLGTSIFDRNVKLAGASGGVYSLITAHVATIILNWGQMGFPLPNFLIFLTYSVADIGYGLYRSDLHISHTTHLCGALAGLLVGVMVLRNIKINKTERILQIIALITYIGLMGAAIIWNLVG